MNHIFMSAHFCTIIYPLFLDCGCSVNKKTPWRIDAKWEYACGTADTTYLDNWGEGSKSNGEECHPVATWYEKCFWC